MSPRRPDNVFGEAEQCFKPLRYSIWAPPYIIMAIEIWQATFAQPCVPDTTLLCKIEIYDMNLPSC